MVVIYQWMILINVLNILILMRWRCILWINELSHRKWHYCSFRWKRKWSSWKNWWRLRKDDYNDEYLDEYDEFNEYLIFDQDNKIPEIINNILMVLAYMKLLKIKMMKLN